MTLCGSKTPPGARESMTFEEAVVTAIEFAGALNGSGAYKPPKDAQRGSFQWRRDRGLAGIFLFAQVADVSVDTETGQLTVHKIWAAHDSDEL